MFFSNFFWHVLSFSETTKVLSKPFFFLVLVCSRALVCKVSSKNIFSDHTRRKYFQFGESQNLIAKMKILEIFISLWILELYWWNFTEIKYLWVLDSCKVSATELKYSQRYEKFSFCSQHHFLCWKSLFSKIFISL